MRDYVLGALQALLWVQSLFEAKKKPWEIKREIDKAIKDIQTSAAEEFINKV